MPERDDTTVLLYRQQNCCARFTAARPIFTNPRGVATIGIAQRVPTFLVTGAVLRRFVAGTSVLALLGCVYVCTYLVDTPIRSDGVSYYVYRPAWIGDGDPTFETIARDCCGGYVADPIGIHR